MKWIVGVDLRSSCEGALRWAQWAARQQDATELVAVHAVEAADLASAVGVGVVQEHADEFLRKRWAGGRTRVVAGRPPAEALANALAVHHADGIVIGRRAGLEDDALVRLGAVARRTLRRLSAPVVVCPADLDESGIPGGPVLVATQPLGHCVPAIRFGEVLARALGRDVAYASVLPPPFPPGITYLPTPQYQGDAHEEATRHLLAWLESQDVDSSAAIIEDGPVVAKLLAAAADSQACAIVCGSRQLSATDRITQSSVGAALAGSARVPVVVVPPP